jgi:cobalt-precorrin 5A hydrolase
VIAIGIGANSRAHKRDFAAAIEEARQEASGDVVATFAEAIFANYVREAARLQKLKYRAVSLKEMRERSKDCLTRSERTLSLFGVASIAEAAALAGAGQGSHLIMPRRIIGNITIAVAQSISRREARE